jgi:small subunit ribosomal protein S17
VKEQGKRKIRIGRVISNKPDKTATVAITKLVRHPLYGRVFRKTKKLHAHDEENAAQMGDLVELTETRPLSKTKRWRLGRIIAKAE